MKWGGTLIALLLALTSCAGPANPNAATPAMTVPAGMTQSQAATLNSLALVDQHPLYTMHYYGPYRGQAALEVTSDPVVAVDTAAAGACPAAWGCSLFAALGDEGNRLYGRNFDWEFSPAVLLFTDPADGYASVSMVDIKYLGFEGERSKNLTDKPLLERMALLDAYQLPFDGLNEKGLAIGMAAVDREEMPNDPSHETVDSLGVMREVLDHAATVEEAVEILGGHNIDMGSVPLHYLVASAAGDSALIEFLDGEMKVFRNEGPWQVATNFIVAKMNGHPQGECPRYDRITGRLTNSEGRISTPDAFDLLSDVSQDTTQWSIVYNMTGGSLSVVMGGDYSGTVHTFRLE